MFQFTSNKNFHTNLLSLVMFGSVPLVQSVCCLLATLNISSIFLKFSIYKFTDNCFTIIDKVIPITNLKNLFVFPIKSIDGFIF